MSTEKIIIEKLTNFVEDELVISKNKQNILIDYLIVFDPLNIKSLKQIHKELKILLNDNQNKLISRLKILETDIIFNVGRFKYWWIKRRIKKAIKNHYIVNATYLQKITYPNEFKSMIRKDRNKFERIVTSPESSYLIIFILFKFLMNINNILRSKNYKPDL